MKRYLNNPTSLILLVAIVVLFGRRALQNPQGWFINELLMIPGIIIGLCFHEYAHAKVAYKLGDPTPKMEKRVTVNPAAHIDPFGLITLLFVGFGWGKSVNINPYNFKNRRRDEFLVSIAGVCMNLILAIVFAVIYKLFAGMTGAGLYSAGAMGYICQMIYYTISINVVLMLFNLLPVPPLDGFGIVTQIFNLERQPWYWTLYNNGFFILMLLIIFNVTDRVLTPLITGVMTIMCNIAGII